jgi:hypothetical protein
MESRVGEDKRKVLLDFQMSICTCANISSVRACAPISDIVGPTVALSRTVIIVLCGATGSGTRRRRTRPPMALPLQPLPPRVPAAEAGPVTAGESGKATLGGARRRRRGAARASPGRRRRLARESWRTCWTTCRWRSGGCMRPMPLSTPRSPQLRADKTQHARTHAHAHARAHARARAHTHTVSVRRRRLRPGPLRLLRRTCDGVLVKGPLLRCGRRCGCCAHTAERARLKGWEAKQQGIDDRLTKRRASARSTPTTPTGRPASTRPRSPPSASLTFPRFAPPPPPPQVAHRRDAAPDPLPCPLHFPLPLSNFPPPRPAPPRLHCSTRVLSSPHAVLHMFHSRFRSTVSMAKPGAAPRGPRARPTDPVHEWRRWRRRRRGGRVLGWC